MRKLSDPSLLNRYCNEFQLPTILSPEILRQLQLFETEKGETVLSVAAPSKMFYFLVRGKLRICITHENGKSVLLRFSKPLSVIGDLELFCPFPVICQVESLHHCHLIGIDAAILQQYARSAPHFLEFIIQHLGFKLYTCSKTASLNQLYPLEQRLASYLLSVCDDAPDGQPSDLLTSTMTELSMLLGTSYRHLCRVLHAFTRQGLIEKERGQLRIRDAARLAALSGGNLYE